MAQEMEEPYVYDGAYRGKRFVILFIEIGLPESVCEMICEFALPDREGLRRRWRKLPIYPDFNYPRFLSVVEQIDGEDLEPDQCRPLRKTGLRSDLVHDCGDFGPWTGCHCMSHMGSCLNRGRDWHYDSDCEDGEGYHGDITGTWRHVFIRRERWVGTGSILCRVCKCTECYLVRRQHFLTLLGDYEPEEELTSRKRPRA